MTDNKLTDEQVIKALECCSNTVSGGMCPICPIDDEDKTCVTVLTENALDLLKRKDAEIDILIRKNNTLKDEIAELKAEIERLRIQQSNLIADYKQIAINAMKKFAERLKEDCLYDYEVKDYFLFHSKIDELLKEMEE